MYEKMLLTTLSAFFGAFFAYLFLRLAESIKNRIDLRRERINSLIKLQIILNEHLNQNSLNNSMFGNLKNIYEESIRTKSIKIVSTIPIELKLSKDILISLKYNNLINDVFAYIIRIGTFNCQVNESVELYKLFREAIMSGAIKPEDYISNFKSYIDRLQKLKLFSNDFMSTITNILARIQLLLQYENKKKYRYFLRSIKESEISKIEIDEKIIELEGQRKQINKKSLEEIDNILNDGNS